MTLDKYLFFSGDKPTIEDENFSRNAVLDGLLDRVSDLFTDGVVAGFGLAKNGSELDVAAGVAYMGGERIVSTQTVQVPWPGTDQHVFVAFTLADGSPKTHYVTGETHLTRRVHGFAVVLKPSSTPAAGEVLVGRALAAGTAEDLRTFCQVTCDPRDHQPNTDTHTTAAEFRVGWQDAQNPGSAALTVQDAIEQQPELALLFRSGILNLQDGHGDRMIETRKIPSPPNAPVLSSANLSLKVHSTAPERGLALRSALDNYLATKVSVEAVDTQISLANTYRSLVNQKRLLGFSLDQIRGDADVSGARDNDVRTKKNEMVVAGAAGVDREAGTLSVTSGSANVTGTGTALDSSLVGLSILLHADGLLKEYTVQAVDVPGQQLTLTEVAGETEPSAWFFKAEAAALGFGAGIATAAEILSQVDAHKAGKLSTRALLIEDKVAHGNTVLAQYTDDDVDQDDAYSLLLTWAKPALVDLEEIRRYRVRVFELSGTRTQIPAGISKAELEASHVDLIYRNADFHTVERQKIEAEDASDLTATGCTTSRIKVAGGATFQPNTRVVVGGVSRVIKAFDSGTKTIELLTPLPSAPGAGASVTSYKLTWDGEVFTERYQQRVRAGQHLVLYAQAITEFDVASDWSAGLVVLTDALEGSSGKSLASLASERSSSKKLRFEVERDRLALEYQEQVLALQRGLAEVATQEQVDTLVGALEELQAGA